MGLISQEFAEKIYDDIISGSAEELDHSDLELLQKLLCSQVGIKMMKRIHYYALIARDQITTIDMETTTGPHVYSRLQGKLQGATEIISGLLGMITIPQDKEDE